VFAAQESRAPESLYQWQWQSGRISNSLDRQDAAVTQYRQAVQTMQSIRGDLAACQGAAGTSSHSAAGSLFLEFVDLLLKKAGEQRGDTAAEPWLLEARDTTELLKEAELQDYFEDECASTMKTKAASVEKLSPNTAIVYTILLPDRVELLLSLPSGLKRSVSPVGREKLLADAKNLRVLLEKRTTSEYMPYAQKLYNYLIRPIEAELIAQQVDTLIFVSDSTLRAIPMAALHDGKQFLITKYAVATTPGLSLTDPRPIQKQKANVLLLGLTEGVQGFPPLSSVGEELSGIENVFDHTTLRNREFISTNVEKEMKKSRYSIVHVASHGKFEGNVKNSFLLTFDGRLSLNKVQQLVGSAQYRENPIELLTLSACQTAAGDDRAALGLAGIAVKSGARSALATLWSVNDPAASALVTEFYKQFQNPLNTKVKALQRAQIKLLDDMRYRHPGYWSAFTLIGNWL
jgi:CHAT domain-containing protein